MVAKVLQRRWKFFFPSKIPVNNVNALAVFEGNAVTLNVETMGGVQNPVTQSMKDINDLLEAKSVVRKSFSKDVTTDEIYLFGADCVFEGKVLGRNYQCTLQAVIPQNKVMPFDSITQCLISAVDESGRAICNCVPIEVPYHHYNASLNKAEDVIKKCFQQMGY